MNAIKRFLATVLAVIIALAPCLTGAAAETQAAKPTAEQYVLLDGDTGQILYEKCMNDRIYPASTTKIVTALMIFNSGVDLDTVVEATSAALKPIPLSATNIALSGGERMPLRELMYALLLVSANDAANVIAEFYVDTFAEDGKSLSFSKKLAMFGVMMTDYVKTLGCESSNFVNPHGLYEDDHYSTAYDMARIMREASQCDELMGMLSTSSHTIPATNKSEERAGLATTNRLLQEGNYYYPYCLGGKTGYTKLAGYGFISAAEKDGRRLISAVYNCSRDNKGIARFTDSRLLFEYGFGSFKKMSLPLSLLPDNVMTFHGDGFTASVTDYVNQAPEFFVLDGMDESDVVINCGEPIITGDTTASVETRVSFKDQSGAIYPEVGTYTLQLKIEKIPDTPPEAGEPEVTAPPEESGEESGHNVGKALGIIATVLLFTAAVAFLALFVKKRSQ
ncbi:MAG: D-alanyl-D-alanine carboxypeptidase [Clostridia bacterium]|nr:D-alanyl-D-alanine carboxypeptidase [Clostridia bacterium]